MAARTKLFMKAPSKGKIITMKINSKKKEEMNC